MGPELTDLERAVMEAIAQQLPAGDRENFRGQLFGSIVKSRENTGVGFFTYFDLAKTTADKIVCNTTSYYVSAEVDGLDGTLGFIVFTKDGILKCLEGYTESATSTAGVDLATAGFRLIDLKKKFLS